MPEEALSLPPTRESLLRRCVGKRKFTVASEGEVEHFKQQARSEIGGLAPINQPMVSICPRKVVCHLTDFAEVAASDFWHGVMVAGAEAMATTAVNFLTDPSAVACAAAEFRGQVS
jgi:hypothetical protein